MPHEDTRGRGDAWLWVCIALLLCLFAVSGMKNGSLGKAALAPAGQEVLQAGN